MQQGRLRLPQTAIKRITLLNIRTNGQHPAEGPLFCPTLRCSLQTPLPRLRPTASIRLSTFIT